MAVIFNKVAQTVSQKDSNFPIYEFHFSNIFFLIFIRLTFLHFKEKRIASNNLFSKSAWIQLGPFFIVLIIRDIDFRQSSSEVTTVEIIPVSLLTQKSSSEWEDLKPPNKHTFRIVVSHLPVMPTQNRFVTYEWGRQLQRLKTCLGDQERRNN